MPAWMIRYCGSWNYKPEAESLSAEMKELGFNVMIEEGKTGQFELFRKIYDKEYSSEWDSYMKAGHGKFFTLRDVEEKLSGKRIWKY